MSTNGEDPLSSSDPNGGGEAGLAGGMGVSSERVGKVRGSDKPATNGLEDTSKDSTPGDADVDEMSEQSFPTSDPPSTWAGSDPS